MKKPFVSLCKSTLLGLALMVAPGSNVVADSLWHVSTSRSMFADKKAQAVGGILPVVIQENNGATRQNNTPTSKKASVNAAIASLLYAPSISGLLTKKGTLPALNV